MRRLARRFVWLLRYERVRLWVVRTRYAFLRRRLAVHAPSPGAAEYTVTHNLEAFSHDAVFGCGGRMGLLIHPIVAYYSHYLSQRWALKVLLVGCRTEDDVLWMRGYGFSSALGFDLLSYSRLVTLGDIHRTSFADNTFDVVVLGWMISYSKYPADVVAECRRILKPGGLLGIGLEHDPLLDARQSQQKRVNALNCAADVCRLVKGAGPATVVFQYDHFQPHDASVALIFRVKKAVEDGRPSPTEALTCVS